MTVSADAKHAKHADAEEEPAKDALAALAARAAGPAGAVPDRRFSIADDDNEDAASCFEEQSAGAAAAASILASLAERSAVVKDTLAGPATLDRRFSIDGDVDEDEVARVADMAAAGAARLATFAGSAPAPPPEPAPAGCSAGWRIGSGRAKRCGLVLTTLAAGALVVLGAARVLIIAL